MRTVFYCLIAAGLACAEPSQRVPNEDERPVAESSSVDAPRPAPSASRLADSSPPAPRSSHLAVLIVGTSLTAGLGLDPADAYPGILQYKADSAGYRVDIAAAGVSGETSAGALRRIDWLLQRPADVVVVETGANDGLRGLDIDSTRANLREILRRAKEAQPSARLFLIQMEAPPNLGARYTDRFRAMFPEVARETGAVLIPFLLDGVAGIAEMNQPDGIHPNVRGSVRVAENIWPVLEPVLRRVP